MDSIPIPESSNQAFVLPSSVPIVLVVIAALILIYSVIMFIRNRAELRQEWEQENAARLAKPQSTEQSTPQPVTIPKNTSFKAKQVISTDALDVLDLIETAVWEINSAFSVLVHCALDRFITLQSSNGSQAEQEQIKRGLKGEVLDYLVIDGEGLPILGVIYYSEGPSNSARTSKDDSIHDIIFALNHAGVRLFEVEPGFQVREFKKRIRKTLKSSIL